MATIEPDRFYTISLNNKALALQNVDETTLIFTDINPEDNKQVWQRDDNYHLINHAKGVLAVEGGNTLICRISLDLNEPETHFIVLPEGKIEWIGKGKWIFEDFLVENKEDPPQFQFTDITHRVKEMDELRAAEEQQKQEQEKKEGEKLDEWLEQERLEQEKLDAEEEERREAEEQERLKQERLKKKQEQERLAKEKEDEEKAEQERQEQEQLAKEKAEQERLEKQRQERDRQAKQRQQNAQKNSLIREIGRQASEVEEVVVQESLSKQAKIVQLLHSFSLSVKLCE